MTVCTFERLVWGSFIWGGEKERAQERERGREHAPTPKRVHECVCARAGENARLPACLPA